MLLAPFVLHGRSCLAKDEGSVVKFWLAEVLGWLAAGKPEVRGQLWCFDWLKCLGDWQIGKSEVRGQLCFDWLKCLGDWQPGSLCWPCLCVCAVAGVCDGETGVGYGTVEYWIRLRVPMDQALRLYKVSSWCLSGWRIQNDCLSLSLSPPSPPSPPLSLALTLIKSIIAFILQLLEM